MVVVCVQVADALTTVKAIVMCRGDVPEGTDCGFPVYTWDQFMEVRSEVVLLMIQLVGIDENGSEQNVTASFFRYAPSCIQTKPSPHTLLLLSYQVLCAVFVL